MSFPSQGPAVTNIWEPGLLVLQTGQSYTRGPLVPWNCPSSMVTIIVSLAEPHPTVSVTGTQPLPALLRHFLSEAPWPKTGRQGGPGHRPGLQVVTEPPWMAELGP